jgi:hypothetical protein
VLRRFHFELDDGPFSDYDSRVSRIQQVEQVVMTMTPGEQEDDALIAGAWKKLGPAPAVDYCKL